MVSQDDHFRPNENAKTDGSAQLTLEIRLADQEDRGSVDEWNSYRLSSSPIYVGLLAGKVVAYLQYRCGFSSPHAFCIETLEVHPGYRRKYIGLALVAHIRARTDVFRLVAEAVQWDAIAFWQALGFLPDGKEEWIEGEDENAGDFEWVKLGVCEKHYQAVRMDNARAVNTLLEKLPATVRIIARMTPLTDAADAYEVVTQVRQKSLWREGFEVLTRMSQDWRTCYHLYREED